MRKCIVDQNNVCINIVIVNQISDYRPSNPNHRILEDGAGEIGWIWNDGSWINPNEVVLTIEQKANIARDKRRRLLKKHVDTMNPIRWESMSQTEKDKWTEYRQKLLDITTQENFPIQIIWPELP